MDGAGVMILPNAAGGPGCTESATRESLSLDSLARVAEAIVRVIGDDANLGDQLRREICKRFTEDIERRCKTTTTQHPSFDQEQQQDYLTDTLLPKLETQLTETVYKRKHYPRKCAELQDMFLQRRINKLVACSYPKNVTMMDSCTRLDAETKAHQLETIATAAATLQTCTQTVDQLIGQTSRVKQVITDLEPLLELPKSSETQSSRLLLNIAIQHRRS